ncbi:MAG: aminoacyl-tRNA hydrolase [Salibacteraceae bacterium]
MKYLVFGLGNIGSEYAETRHNIGFKILDELASSSSIFFDNDKLATRAIVKHRGRQIVLLKPSTYMNLSGKSVNYWMQKEKVPLDRVLIITDDIALPFGKLRLRGKGSDGGHNGLKNINQVLGQSNYARLRFGVGSEFNPGSQVNYVLGKWTNEEQKLMPERLKKCGELILSFATIGLGQTMSNFNNK